MHSPHLGYVTLFPLALGRVAADSAQMDQLLGLLETVLRTPYGVPSLATNDTLFGTGENYWRGKVWVNLNYLVLRGLRAAAAASADAERAARIRRVEADLHAGLLSAVEGAYAKQGFLFETSTPRRGPASARTPSPAGRRRSLC